MILEVTVAGFFARVFFASVFYLAILAALTVGAVRHLALGLNLVTLGLLVLATTGVWILISPVFVLGGKIGNRRKGASSSAASTGGVPSSIVRFVKVSFILTSLATFSMAAFMGGMTIAYSNHVSFEKAELPLGTLSFKRLEEEGSLYEVTYADERRKTVFRQQGEAFALHGSVLRYGALLKSTLSFAELRDGVQVHWLMHRHERGAIEERLDGDEIYPSKGLASFALYHLFRYLPGIDVETLDSSWVMPRDGAVFQVRFRPEGSMLRLSPRE